MNSKSLEAFCINPHQFKTFVLSCDPTAFDKNKNWLRTAQKYIPKRKEEFDTINPSFKKPVFLTSEYLYRLLLNDDLNRLRTNELYKLECTMPIPEQNNKLDRPLFPLYRHPRYNLKNWDNYLKKGQDYFF